jgi:hypothetical protein
MTLPEDQATETRLLYAEQKRSTLIYWPESVDQRLDELLELVRMTGTHASRAQLLAALVVSAERDGGKLAETVQAYRRMTVTAVPSATKERRRRPGPQRPTSRRGA